MKKRVIQFFVFSFISIQSFSQLSGGIRAGGNFTNITGPESKDYKFKPGFHAGAYLEYDFAEKFSFQTEAVYSVKGFRNKYSSTTLNITSDYDVLYNLAYIDVPFILNVNFGEMGSYLGIGPQISFLANAKYDGEASISGPSYPAQTVTIAGSGTDGWNPVDFGVILGTGSKFDSGIEYCLRAGYGLTNVFDPKQASNDETYHNLVFSVTLGYAFGETSGSYGGSNRYKKRRR